MLNVNRNSDNSNYFTSYRHFILLVRTMKYYGNASLSDPKNTMAYASAYNNMHDLSYTAGRVQFLLNMQKHGRLIEKKGTKVESVFVVYFSDRSKLTLTLDNQRVKVFSVTGVDNCEI